LPLLVVQPLLLSVQPLLLSVQPLLHGPVGCA
jgi:hypothetical protein